MLIEKVNTEYNNCRIPGLIMTGKGTLIGYYECRDASSDWAKIDIKVIRSIDKGETWETVTKIKNDNCTINNPVMIVDGKSIHFLFCKNYKQLYYCKSDDDGKSFSEPAEISSVFDEGKFPYTVAAIGPGHGIVHNNTILIPAWFAYNEEDPKSHFPSFISSIYSADGGKSWHLGEVIKDEKLKNASECALERTRDGKVLISIRNESPQRCRGLAFSANGYSDWSDIIFADKLPDPVCQGSMDSENGTIYHINCADEEQRVNLTIMISNNCFTDVVKSILVDEIGGYADIAVSDGVIYVLYERDVLNDGLYFKKFTVN